jgi:hypothetical protein
MTEKDDRTPGGVDVHAFLQDPNFPKDAKERVRKAGQLTTTYAVTTDADGVYHLTPTQTETQREAEADRRMEAQVLIETVVTSKEMLLQRFEDAARDFTFKRALIAVARKYGMVDLGGKVLWPARFINKARNAHARARRDHLEYEPGPRAGDPSRPGGSQ